ncbi:MAG: hypothetical protein M1546_06970 [Chloroflexi bacterium]|nr:hypothetical protein [Chloroflexota bacterium]
MSKWTPWFAAVALVLATSCSSPATTATTAPTVEPTAVPTTAPTEPAPTATAAATDTPAATTAAPAEATAAGSSGAEQDFAPKERSVWNTAVGLDNMSGTCAKGSMLPVYGLVQITPQGDTLNWKSQEPAPYTFNRMQVNLYRYSGPTALKDGVVTMTLQFLSDKELEMNREFVADADPNCTHTHVYTGTFQWARP